jgi:hypothetical protein
MPTTKPSRLELILGSIHSRAHLRGRSRARAFRISVYKTRTSVYKTRTSVYKTRTSVYKTLGISVYKTDARLRLQDARLRLQDAPPHLRLQDAPRLGATMPEITIDVGTLCVSAFAAFLAHVVFNHWLPLLHEFGVVNQDARRAVERFEAMLPRLRRPAAPM